MQEGTLARVDAGGNFEQEEVLGILPLVVSEPRKRPNGSKPTSAHNVFSHFP